MANIGGVVRARLVTGKNPLIYNVTVALANTETSQVLTSNVKKLMIRCRGNATIKLAYVATESATNFITIRPGTVYKQDNVDFTGTIYFQVSKAGQVVEIEEWT